MVRPQEGLAGCSCKPTRLSFPLQCMLILHTCVRLFTFHGLTTRKVDDVDGLQGKSGTSLRCALQLVVISSPQIKLCGGHQ
jgi:hypothetical protein